LEGLAGKVALSIGAGGDCGKGGYSQQKTVHEESPAEESSSLNLPDSPSEGICPVCDVHKPLICLPASRENDNSGSVFNQLFRWRRIISALMRWSPL
jgi:hypothetical protein